jgi:hypothetical protein
MREANCFLKLRAGFCEILIFEQNSGFKPSFGGLNILSLFSLFKTTG